MEGYKWAISDEAGFTSEHMTNRVITNIEKLFDTWTPREDYEFINVSEVKENVLPHKLLY